MMQDFSWLRLINCVAIRQSIKLYWAIANERDRRLRPLIFLRQHDGNNALGDVWVRRIGGMHRQCGIVITLVSFAGLALIAIGLQMLFYNTINLPEIRTGVIAVLLTADPDLQSVFERMPLRQLCAAACAVLALLIIAVGTPVMESSGCRQHLELPLAMLTLRITGRPGPK